MSRFHIPDVLQSKGQRRAVRIIAVLIASAALLYAIFSPPRFPLGDEYIFSPADGEMRNTMIIEPGGRIVLGPSDIRLWGCYPFVYGTEKSEKGETRFILDIKEHTFQTFPVSENGENREEEEEFESFLRKNGFRIEYTVSLHDLFQGPEELRLHLKQLLGKR